MQRRPPRISPGALVPSCLSALDPQCESLQGRTRSIPDSGLRFLANDTNRVKSMGRPRAKSPAPQPNKGAEFRPSRSGMADVAEPGGCRLQLLQSRMAKRHAVARLPGLLLTKSGRFGRSRTREKSPKSPHTEQMQNEPSPTSSCNVANAAVGTSEMNSS